MACLVVLFAFTLAFEATPPNLQNVSKDHYKYWLLEWAASLLEGELHLINTYLSRKTRRAALARPSHGMKKEKPEAPLLWTISLRYLTLSLKSLHHNFKNESPPWVGATTFSGPDVLQALMASRPVSGEGQNTGTSLGWHATGSPESGLERSLIPNSSADRKRQRIPWGPALGATVHAEHVGWSTVLFLGGTLVLGGRGGEKESGLSVSGCLLTSRPL